MIKTKYPIFFKLLSKEFGARKAKRLIKSVVESEIKKSRYEVIDGDNISGMFVFSNTPQGHSFWLKLANKFDGFYV